MDRPRRALLRTAAVAAAAGLAGCSGDEAEACTELAQEPDYAGWLDPVSNYDRTCDHRGAEEVTVRVGVRANDAYWGYGPAALAVAPGTTVHWDWTGRGGPHNVVGVDGRFDSGRAVEGDDHEFRQTFDDPGVYNYYCAPHRSVDMKGAVFVALE